MCVGAGWGLAAVPVITERLPKAHLRSRPHGLSLDFDWSLRRSKRRLKKETLELTQEIFDYLNEQPMLMAERVLEWHAEVKEREKAKTNDERSQLFWEQAARQTEKSDAERHALAARFGGRLDYLFREYRRRGFLTETEVAELEWATHSADRMKGVAVRLEGMAHQL
jgi:hypothetical protein